MGRRSKSSGRWLDEHFKDPYVRRAQDSGLRSRAAFKLEEIDAAEKLIFPGAVVVDLGAAPGGWSQYAARRLAGNGRVFALDLLPMDAITGVTILLGDFREQAALDALLAELGPRRVDLVMSDMAPNISGVDVVDQARAADLESLALEFSRQVLGPGGVLHEGLPGRRIPGAACGGPAHIQGGPDAQAQGVEAAEFRDLFGGQGTPVGVR